jgi:GGDEF domain-containing protein
MPELKPFTGDLDESPPGVTPFKGVLDGEPVKTTTGDVLKSVGQGVAEGVGFIPQFMGNLVAQGVNRGARALNLPDPELRAVNPLQSVVSYLEDRKTPGGRRAVELSTPAGNILEPSTWSLGEDPSVGGYMQNIARVVGQYAVPLGVGAVGKVLKAGDRAMDVAGAVTGAAQAGGAALDQEGTRVRSMPEAQLVETSPKYRELLASGVDPASARERVAQDTELAAGTIGAIPAAIEGSVVQRLLRGRMALPTVGKSAPARIASAAVAGGAGEGFQETTEQVAQNIGARIGTGEDRNLGEDTFGSAVLGAAGGKLAGAGIQTLREVGARGTSGSTGQEQEPPKAPSEPPKLFPFQSESAAAKRAATKTESTGQPYTVIPHPVREGRFAVVPESEVAKFTEAKADEALERLHREGKRDIAMMRDFSQTTPSDFNDEPRIADPSRIVAAINASRGPKARPLAPTEEALVRRIADGEFGEPQGLTVDDLVEKGVKRGTAIAMLKPVKQAMRGLMARQQVASATIDREAHQAATSPQNGLPEPTPAQKDAGNYKKGHVRVHGLDISIENPQGSVRSGVGPNGQKWQQELKSHYGYIRSLRVEPGAAEVAGDGLSADAKLFSDAVQAKAIRTKGLESLDIKDQAVVQRSVLAALQDRQVLRAVIKLVPVDVMNVLVGKEIAPEALLRDPSVLMDRLSSPLDDAVRAPGVRGFIDAIATSLPDAFAELGAKEKAALGVSAAPGVDTKGRGTGGTSDVAGHGQYFSPKGADKHHIDVFLGPKPEGARVFVVDQVKPGNRHFDEHKVLIGFDSVEEARAGYLANYEPGWKGLGAITETTPEDLKTWLTQDNTTRPFGELKEESNARAMEDAAAPAAEAAPVQPADAGERAEALPDAAGDAAVPAGRARAGTPGAQDRAGEAKAAVAEPKITREQRTLARRVEKAHETAPQDVKMAVQRVGKSMGYALRQGMSWESAEAAERGVRTAGLAFQAIDYLRTALGIPKPGTVDAASTPPKAETKAVEREPEKPKLETKPPADETVAAKPAAAAPAQKAAKTPAGFKISPAAGKRAQRDATRARLQQARAAREAPKPGQGERRKDTEGRKRVADMTPKERARELLTSAVTGIPNFRAFQEDQDAGPAKLVGYADGDNFKAVNSILGHDAADEVLRAMGAIFARAAASTGAKAYHRSGDEFLFRFESKAQAEAFEKAAYDLSAGTTLTFEVSDGRKFEYRNPSFSMGSGDDAKAAELDAEGAKQRRLANGERGRDRPPGLSEIPAPGGQAGQRDASAGEETGVAAAPPGPHDAVPKDALGDFGEKIGGARKDRWRERGLSAEDLDGMSGGEQAQYATKDNVWPKIDYAARIAAGMEPKAAALLKIVRDRMAASPRKDTPEGRRTYVDMVGRVRRLAETITTVDAMKGLSGSVQADLGLPENMGLSDRYKPENKAKLEQLFSVYKGRHSPFAINWSDASRADRMLADGWPKKAAVAGEGGEKQQGPKIPERPHLDKLQRTGEDVRGGRDVTSREFTETFGFRGIEFGNWAANDERQRILNMAFEALHDLAGVLRVPPKAISLNGTMGLALAARGGGKFAAHYEPGKLVINMTKLRGGGSLAHEWGHALDHYFGELGQSNAYQGLARGASGWYKRADYRGRQLPNLRPEVAAAFNDVMRALFMKSQSKAEMVRDAELRLERAQAQFDAETSDPHRKGYYGRSIESQKRALAELRERQGEGERIYAGGNSSFATEANKLSGKSGADGYWSRPTEMFARAFEAYVFDRIRGNERVSDYLVHGVEPERYAVGYKGNPYPAGVERESIGKAFDRLFQVIESQETPRGVALFSTAPAREASSTGPSVPTLQRLVARLRRNWTNAPAIHIHESPADIDFDLKPDAAGAFYQGEVHLFRSNLRSEAHAEFVALHESVGHYGLLGALGEGLQPTMARIYRTNDAVRTLADEWKRNNPRAELESDEQYDALAAEEALADLAGTGMVQKQGFWRQLVAAIRRAMRAAGFALEVSDNEVALLLADAKRFVEGAPTQLVADQRLQPALVRSGKENVDRLGTAQRFMDDMVERIRKDAQRPEIGITLTRTMPNALQAVGVPNLPLHLPGNVAMKSVGRDPEMQKHRWTLDDPTMLARIVPDIFEPVMVFQSNTQADSVVIVTRVRDSQGQPIIVSIRKRGLVGRANDQVAVITSIYPRQDPQASFENWARKGLLLYYDRAKVAEMTAAAPSTTSRLELPSVVQLGAAAGKSVLDDSIVVKRYGAMFSHSTAAFDLGKLSPALQDRLGDILKTQRKFNWWHRTVGTQYHKATVSPEFRPVFEASQRFVQDVSLIATESADEAPSLLPKLESLVQTAKDFLNVKGTRDHQADVKKVAAPVFKGTLQDNKVYTAAELAKDFGLTPRQQALYFEHRAAVDRSLDLLAVSEMGQLARGYAVVDPELPRVIAEAKETGDPHEALSVFRQRLQELARSQPEAYKQEIGKTLNTLELVVERVDKLKHEGYAPLMRFGQHYVYFYTQKPNGERETKYFALHESERDANADYRRMLEEFKDEKKVRAEHGLMSEESYKLFKGISPETLELFADALGVGEDAGKQAFLRLAISQRSALKRMIHRKGIEGYSEDVGRTLAAFITSNARLASKNYHMGEIKEAADAIRSGDVKDDAMKLVQYLEDPKEEAAKFRGFLFLQYLGGSAAAALVNATQPITMSLPYLAQWGAGAAATQLARGVRIALGKGDPDAELAIAMKRAAEEGVTEPAEIHQLYAEAIRGLGSNIFMRRFFRLWGSAFQLAEAFNRKTTFAAAYQIARDLTLEQLQQAEVRDAYDFAVKAVHETQGIYNKANRPNWARGPIGSTLFTFKQFSISYLEFVQRLPRKQQALALAILMLAAGLQGLPFADDLEDLIDSMAESLGYNFSTEKEAHTFIAESLGLGKGVADWILYGTSTLPGMPLDIQGRMGLGNLIPGTSLLKKSQTDKGRDALEVFGPAGGLIKSGIEAFSAVQGGRFGAAAEGLAPVAVKNVVKATDMAIEGHYRDTRGRRVVETGPADVAVKAIGFQPADVAAEQRAIGRAMPGVVLARVTEGEIAAQWAEGVFERDPGKVRAARERWAAWNEKNPETPIQIQQSQITRRVREMASMKRERVLKSAPKEARAELAKDLAR